MVKKEKELKGMPAKDQLYLEGEALLSAQGEVKDTQYNFKVVKKEMMAMMKRLKREAIVVKSSDGKNKRIVYEETEGLKIQNIK